MDESPNLRLPFLLPSQAQKHVTHNEALLALDAVVQLAVEDRSLSLPPPSPSDGARFIVGPLAGGAWSGRENQVAAWQDGAWTFLAPRAGWLAWVADEEAFAFWTGAEWADLPSAFPELSGVERLGVLTLADATNRLAVKSDAVLFSHNDVTPGSGDMQVKVNKAAAARDAGVVFQTGYSARALFGLLANDDFSLKVSPDGVAYQTALAVDRSSGAIGTVPGTAATPALRIGGGSTGLFNPAPGVLAFATTGAVRGRFTDGQFLLGADYPAQSLGSVTPGLQQAGGSANASSAMVGRFSADANGPTIYVVKSRAATIGAGGAVQINDALGAIGFAGDFGTGLGVGASITARVRQVWSTEPRWTDLEFMTRHNAAGIRLKIKSNGDLTDGSDNVWLDGQRVFRNRMFTLATLPPAADGAGQSIGCSDLGGGAGQLFSDGTAWRRTSGGGSQTIASDAAVTLTVLANAENQYHTGSLTADRTITLSSASTHSGARFRVTRTGPGAFSLGVGGLKSLVTNTWAEVVHDGSNWRLGAYGTL